VTLWSDVLDCEWRVSEFAETGDLEICDMLAGVWKSVRGCNEAVNERWSVSYLTTLQPSPFIDRTTVVLFRVEAPLSQLITGVEPESGEVSLIRSNVCL
jgi:hypothetical protein